MHTDLDFSRRELISRAGVITAGLALAATPLFSCAAAETIKGKTKPENNKEEKQDKDEEEEISPVEDLMREHGVLNRLLLIYEDQQKRLVSGAEYNVSAISRAAGLFRRFIEDYHERQEEQDIFPRFESGSGMLAVLVRTLRSQHEAGRIVTEAIQGITVRKVDQDGRVRLANRIGQFIRMYRPHEAREDTVLFPALHTMMSDDEFEKMGERFEAREHQQFGENGFQTIVGQVAEIERELGLFDLAQFTPKV